MAESGACNSACVGLAVGLSMLFFLFGVGLIFYYREKIYLMRKSSSLGGQKSQDKEEEGEGEEKNEGEEGGGQDPSFVTPPRISSSTYQDVDLEAGVSLNTTLPVEEEEAAPLPESPDSRETKSLAQDLQYKLEEMESEQRELEEKSRKLQEEIQYLSKMNNVMALDHT
ncbi:hypothetical protein BASA81_000017 [Batrachochytrium salamandrivorans]|nr:hypothetical protein BASA81_000017 [Batrachochytrium salamandrivorans]